MKTIHTIRQLAVVAFLSMLTMAATGQQNTRPSNDNANRQGREQYSRNEGRTSYESKGNQNYKRDNQNRKRDDRHYKKDDRKNGQYNTPQTARKPASAHVHHSPPRPVYRQPARVRHAPSPHAYYRHLPTQRVNRFHYNGYDYYHSNNHFYRYHPHHGYRIVEAPFSRVRYLPARYQVRVYNGYSYPYYNGYFFLPAEYGYVMVPAPARPHRSFNIVLNL